jgi:hypothetical protein
MTDRAEPGVTPLTAAVHTYFEDNVEGGCVHFDKGFGPYAACEDPDNLVPIRAVQSLLDAATPRPGLVEALERLAATFVSEATYHGSEVAGRIRALASGTGEPGLDVERLARSLRALEARGELTVADGFLGGRDDGDYVTFATSIAAAYANDKGADR